ncbi:MAG: hypothetical protein D3905_08755 [Candidatus Electrothrix sp. AS4_5]|nr:hypothetical protein [Candidatus Electrothrix gigas]
MRRGAAAENRHFGNMQQIFSGFLQTSYPVPHNSRVRLKLMSQTIYIRTASVYTRKALLFQHGTLFS